MGAILNCRIYIVPPLESSEKKYLNDICLKKLKIPLVPDEIVKNVHLPIRKPL